MDLDDVTTEVEEAVSEEAVEEGVEEEAGQSPEPDGGEDEEIGLFEHSSDYPDEFNARIRKANKLFREYPKIEAEREQLRGDLDAFRRAIEEGQLQWKGSSPEPEPEIPEGSVGDEALDRALELMRNPDTAEKGTVEVLKALAEIRRENRELREGLTQGQQQTVEQQVRTGVPRLLEKDGLALNDTQKAAAVKLYRAGVLDRGLTLGQESPKVIREVLDEVKQVMSLQPQKKKSPSPSPDTTSGRGAGLTRKNPGKAGGSLSFDEIRKQIRAGAFG